MAVKISGRGNPEQPRSLSGKRKKPEPDAVPARPRQLPAFDDWWEDPPQHNLDGTRPPVRIQLVADNMQVVQWIRGRWKANLPVYSGLVRAAQKTIHSAITANRITTRMNHVDIIRHAHRERNKKADALATEAIRSIRETGELSAGMSTHEHFNLKDLYGLKWLRTFADGGLRDHISSSAWVVEGASERREDGSPDWRILCTGTAWNGDRTSMYAEIYATVEGLQATLRIVKLAFDL